MGLGGGVGGVAPFLRMWLALAKHLKDPTAGSGRVRQAGLDEVQRCINTSRTAVTQNAA